MPATVWRGRLVFGMVSIPVRLHKAGRRERIRFRHVYRPAAKPEPEESPGVPTLEALPPKGNLHQMPRTATAGAAPAREAVALVHSQPVGDLGPEPVEKRDVLKGYEMEKNRFVTLEPREVAALRPQTSTELAIAEFVKLEEIDPLFFDASYYAAPDRGGEKPYALFYRALAETGYAAVGSLAMHGREHATVIRPGRRGLILHTLFYANEVRADEEYDSNPALVSAKELELAKLFVRALAAKFEPAGLKDTFEERLHALIQARAGAAVAAYEHAQPAGRAPVTDIMEALRKSLEMARKPPKTEIGKPIAKRPRRSPSRPS
ncbi:MAG TPA: Ku protein [Bryobacteraceae bacterium]|nr:Ku protein [Bryobacteraceae bacterium]